MSKPVDGYLTLGQERIERGGMRYREKEETVAHPLNGEQSRCSASREPVLEEINQVRNPEVASACVSAVPQGEYVGDSFSRPDDTLKDFSTDNRVPGDTDPLSKLYGNSPTCYVHLKTSIEGLPMDFNVVRESLQEYLYDNGISHKQASVYNRNNLGCPFDFIQVIFESKSQAEQWFVKAGRKITLQQTPHMKAEYYMYYAEPPWACLYCRKVTNVFFRSLCYVCFYHKSGVLTNVRFTDDPSPYIGAIKIGPSVNETNVLEHLHKSFKFRNIKSIRIVDDPAMNCCCGLVVIEFSSIEDSVRTHKWSLKKNLNTGLLRYIEIDDDSSDPSIPKVSFRYAVLTKLVGKKEDTAKKSKSSEQCNIQEIGGVEESQNGYSDHHTKDNIRSRAHDVPSSSSTNSINVEFGFSHDFDYSDAAPCCYDGPEMKQRVVEYYSGRDRQQQELDSHSRSWHKPDERTRFYDDYGDSLPSEEENDQYYEHGRGRSRSRSPIPRSLSPPYHRTSLTYRSPPSRHFSARRPHPPRVRSQPPRGRSRPPRGHSRLSRRRSRRYSTFKQAPKPDGSNNDWTYPQPKTSKLKFDPIFGLNYDCVTRLHFENETGLFYNSDLNIHLKYDQTNSRYVRVD